MGDIIDNIVRDIDTIIENETDMRVILKNAEMGSSDQMTIEETNDIKDDRDCTRCVWRGEYGCTVWSCDYMGRDELHAILRDNPGLRKGGTNG